MSHCLSKVQQNPQFPSLRVCASVPSVCARPELGGDVHIKGDQRYFNPGVRLTLTCKRGYSPVSGPRSIICSTSGKWTRTNFFCSGVFPRCPHPIAFSNGELHYTDNVYGSTINYTCHKGYNLIGAHTAECLANGSWSAPVPECKSVECGLAPIPQYGAIIYNKMIRGNSTRYGTWGTYRCLPPYVIFGDARAECTASGTWTKTPECQVVTCPPPENIDRGYKSNNEQRPFDYTETVKYGCLGEFVLEGSFQIVCQKNGNWSEKPSCKGEPTREVSGRVLILYRGRNMYIKELKPDRVLHNEIVSFYCMDEARKCDYVVPTQCIDGEIIIPECFEEPSVHSDSLPSEIAQC
uniref:Beta-2-glycoprotein 1 n=1 Tax=Mola mola TaxID=94237 RepID=A0A3Q3VWX1_MOLML